MPREQALLLEESVIWRGQITHLNLYFPSSGNRTDDLVLCAPQGALQGVIKMELHCNSTQRACDPKESSDPAGMVTGAQYKVGKECSLHYSSSAFSGRVNVKKKGPELLCRARQRGAAGWGRWSWAPGAFVRPKSALCSAPGLREYCLWLTSYHNCPIAGGSSSAVVALALCVFTSAYIQGECFIHVTARACGWLSCLVAVVLLLLLLRSAHCTSWSSSRWKGFAQIATSACQRWPPGSCARAPVPRAAASPWKGDPPQLWEGC